MIPYRSGSLEAFSVESFFGFDDHRQQEESFSTYMTCLSQLMPALEWKDFSRVWKALYNNRLRCPICGRIFRNGIASSPRPGLSQKAQVWSPETMERFFGCYKPFIFQWVSALHLWKDFSGFNFPPNRNITYRQACKYYTVRHDWKKEREIPVHRFWLFFRYHNIGKFNVTPVGKNPSTFRIQKQIWPRHLSFLAWPM